jgi:hypothetical protein
MKNTFGSNLFENKDFFKILKTDDQIIYLAKFVEQLFSKTHLGASESAKTLFCDVIQVENLDKKCLTYEKEPEKSI